MSDQLDNYDKNTIQNQLRDILARVASLEQRDVAVDHLEEFSPDLGNVAAENSVRVREYLDPNWVGYGEFEPNSHEIIDEDDNVVARFGSYIDALGARALVIDVLAPLDGGFNNKSKIILSARDVDGVPSVGLTIDCETGKVYTGAILPDYEVLCGLPSTYTPTLTKTTNAAAVTAYPWMYMKIGNMVTMAGPISIDPTAAGAVVIGIDLPVVSNFANDYEASGVAAAHAVAGLSASIAADTTNDRLILRFVAVNTANQLFQCVVSYLVL